MIDAVIIAATAHLTAEASKALYEAIKEYLGRKGQKLSDSPTKEEISRAFTSLEKQEPPKIVVAETQGIFGSAISQLLQYRTERERQARNSFNLACIVLAAGSAIVLAGIVWMLFGSSVAPGMVTSAVGAITSLSSGVLFKFSKDSNDRLDDVAMNMHEIESTRIALAVVQNISNESERNAAINQIASGLSQKGKTPTPRGRAGTAAKGR